MFIEHLLGETLFLLLVIKSVTDRWQKRWWRCQLQVHCPSCLSLCESVSFVHLSAGCSRTDLYVRGAFLHGTRCTFSLPACHLRLGLVVFIVQFPFTVCNILKLNDFCFVCGFWGVKFLKILWEKTCWLLCSCSWVAWFGPCLFNSGSVVGSRLTGSHQLFVCVAQWNWRHFHCFQCLLKCTWQTEPHVITGLYY